MKTFGDPFVVDSMFAVAPGGFCVWSLFCYAVPGVLSMFAIIFMMVALLPYVL